MPKRKAISRFSRPVALREEKKFAKSFVARIRRILHKYRAVGERRLRELTVLAARRESKQLGRAMAKELINRPRQSALGRVDFLLAAKAEPYFAQRKSSSAFLKLDQSGKSGRGTDATKSISDDREDKK
jgi:hypothetical protein